jgi:hypothetical protein
MRILPRTVRNGDTTYRVHSDPFTRTVRLTQVVERLSIADFDDRLRTGALQVLDPRFLRQLDDDFLRLLGRPVPNRKKEAPAA